MPKESIAFEIDVVAAVPGKYKGPASCAYPFFILFFHLILLFMFYCFFNIFFDGKNISVLYQ